MKFDNRRDNSRLPKGFTYSAREVRPKTPRRPPIAESERQPLVVVQVGRYRLELDRSCAS